MHMEAVRSSTVAAALLFLTLVAFAAASSAIGSDDAAAAVEEQQCHRYPLSDDEPYMQLGALANTCAAADEEQAGYMLVGMQTGGGDMIRLVVVADQQRYFFITGYAKGWFSSRLRWSFRDGERHRLLPLGSSNGSSSHSSSCSSSHAEVVASNVLRALINAGSSSSN